MSVGRLSALPGELQLTILEFIQPDDLVNLACTSRRMHELASERLVHHRAYFKRYGDLFLADVDGEFPRELLHQISKDPDIAWYIRKICYDCRNYDGQFEKEQHTIPETIALHELLNGIPFLKDDQIFLRELDEGKPNAGLAFVLALAKNVSSLFLSRDASLERYFMAASSSSQGYFSKLRIAETTQEYPLTIDNIRQFFQLPALDLYTIHVLTQYEGHRSNERAAKVDRRCLCKALDFADPDADGDVIAEVLRNVTELQELCLDFAQPDNKHREDNAEYLEEDGWRWRTEEFVLGLKDCALNSLKKLTLSFCVPPLDKLPSLACFSQLREFDGPLDLLTTTRTIAEDGVQLIRLNLTDYYPNTLESLALTTWATWREDLEWRVSRFEYTSCDAWDRDKMQADFDEEATVRRELELSGLDAYVNFSKLRLSEESLCSRSKDMLAKRGISVTIVDGYRCL